MQPVCGPHVARHLPLGIQVPGHGPTEPTGGLSFLTLPLGLGSLRQLWVHCLGRRRTRAPGVPGSLVSRGSQMSRRNHES